MSAQPFLLGAYVVTAIVIALEIVAVLARLRAAAAAARDAQRTTPAKEALQ
jgi:hypothetical protein